MFVAQELAQRGRVWVGSRAVPRLPQAVAVREERRSVVAQQELRLALQRHRGERRVVQRRDDDDGAAAPCESVRRSSSAAGALRPAPMAVALWSARCIGDLVGGRYFRSVGGERAREPGVWVGRDRASLSLSPASFLSEARFTLGEIPRSHTHIHAPVDTHSKHSAQQALPADEGAVAGTRKHAARCSGTHTDTRCPSARDTEVRTRVRRGRSPTH